MPPPSRAGVEYFRARLNEEMLFPPSHSTQCGSSVRLRDDVGIVPYIHVGVRTIQRSLHLNLGEHSERR